MKISSLKQNGIMLAAFLALMLFFVSNAYTLSEVQKLSFSIFLSLVAFSLLIKKASISIMSPFTIVLGCLIMSYLLRPLYIFTANDFISFVPTLNSIPLQMSYLWALVFSFSFFVGYFVFKSFGNSIGGRIEFPFSQSWNSRRVKLARAILLLIALFTYILMFERSGMSFIEAFKNPFVFRLATTAGGSFYVSGISLWCIWSVFYLTVIFRALKSKIEPLSSVRKIRTLHVSTFLLFIFMAALTFPFGSRGYILLPILGVIWLLDASSLLSNKRLSFLSILPVVLGMIVFASVYGLFREVGAMGFSQGVFLKTLYEEGFSLIINNLIIRFDSFDFWALTFNNFAPDSGYFWGKSILDFLIQPIPRSIFPEKAYKTSAYLTQFLLPELPKTFTPEYGLISELYINFWMPGIILGGVFYGITIRALEAFLHKNRSNPSMLFWYAPMVTLPMGWLLAGFNSDASISLVINTVLSTLLLIFITQKK